LNQISPEAPLDEVPNNDIHAFHYIINDEKL